MSVFVPWLETVSPVHQEGWTGLCVMVELVNILTRTSGRPRFFRHNRDAVLGQSYPHVRHLVCYDDEATGEYVRAAVPGEDAIAVTHAVREDSGHFPYNLYLNRLLAEVHEGWVIFLDDDDLLMRGDAIAKMVATVQAIDEVLLWQVQFPRGRLVPRRVGKKLVVGDVTCCGFMFHISQLKRLERDAGPLWSDRKGGDFLVIQRCYELLRPRWLEDVLTGVNYLEPRNIGSGLRQDCSDRSILEPETEIGTVCLKRRVKGAREHIAMPRGNAVKKLAPPVLRRIDAAAPANLVSAPKPLVLTIAPRRKESAVDAPDDCARQTTPIVTQVTGNDTEERKDTTDEEQEEMTRDDDPALTSEESTNGCIDPEELVDDVQENGGDPAANENPQREFESPSSTALAARQARSVESSRVIAEHIRGSSSELVEVPLSRAHAEPVSAELCSASIRLPLNRVHAEPIAGSKAGDSDGAVKKYHLTEEELDELADKLFMRWQKRSGDNRQGLVEISHGSGLILPTPVGKEITKKEVPPRGGLPKATEVLDANRQENRRLLEAGRRGMRRGGEAALKGMTPSVETVTADAGSDGPNGAGVTLDNYFGQIYIIDQRGAGNTLQKTLGDIGVMAKVVKMGKGERADSKSTIFDFLPQVATEAQKKACPRVLVLLDQAMPHQALMEEFALLGEALGGQEAVSAEPIPPQPGFRDREKPVSWRVLYCGAAQNLVKSEQFDSEFYLEQYSDLVNAKITDEQLATRHWHYYGQKEGRFGFRGWEAPQVIKDVCAIALDARLYEEIGRCRKSPEVLKVLTRYLEEDSLACSPLLFMSATGRKNRFNLQRYIENAAPAAPLTVGGNGRRGNSRL